MLPKTVILLGAPGSGKDTQAFALAKTFGYFVLVTGDLFRAEVKHHSEIGQKMQEIMQSGQLLPDDMVMGVVANELERHRSVIEANGLLFDGFPRTVPEIADAENLIDRYQLRPDIAVVLEVPESELMKRLTSRGRADDASETATKRLMAYQQETLPVVEHYQTHKKLLIIDGVGSVDEVSERVVQALKAYDVQN